jgi:DNA invertase Pin-like site-specific DNA recombinase
MKQRTDSQLDTSLANATLCPLRNSKIGSEHLSRLAVIYVRQSSARQVRENVESTQLQYNLATLARAYGWPEEQIITIDDDLGVSGRSLEGRVGFQRLLAEISLSHIGLVMGIEMSRLARNCRDWHQLLELCAVCGSLLGDADGIYNPRDHNDRLLLGLKGTMSEAELHVLQGRLDSGRKNKARRGEYFAEAPIGYVRTRDGVALEPDQQAQDVVRLLFRKFDELGSANAVLRYFHDHQIQIGRRRNNGPQPDDLSWSNVSRSTILHILKHPIYAGAYVFGRTQSVTVASADGNRRTVQRRVEPDDWPILIRDVIPAYISWGEWEKNQEKLRKNSSRFGFGPARGGSLLAGRISCGRCENRMAIHYRDSNPYFSCCIAKIQYGRDSCQSFNGRWLEPLIANLIVQTMKPASLQLSLRASEAIEQDRERLHHHHQQSVERAVYQADLARRRYKEVDPANRLVAGELERDLETALQNQRRAEEHLNRFRLQTPDTLTKNEMQSITNLSDDFERLWNSPETSDADRQNLVRILIDRIDVEVVNGTERLLVTVHWAGGFTSHHESRRCVQSFDHLEDSDGLLQRTRQLYNLGYSQADMIRQLNSEGFRPARAKQFTRTSFPALMLLLRRKKLVSNHPVLPENFWRATRLAETLGIACSTLTQWRHRGWVQATDAGSRWIYWADNDELNRLRKLRSSHVNGLQHPEHLTRPSSKMPNPEASTP